MAKSSGQSLSNLVSKRWLVVAAFVAIVVVAAATLVIYRSAMPRVELCSTRNLTGWAALQGETGSQVGFLTIQNVGSTACSLPTRPSVVLNWRRGVLATHQIPTPDDESQAFGGSVVNVLRPHAKATVELVWNNWCQSALSAFTPFRGSLLVALAHSSSPLRIDMMFAEVARCDSPNEQSTLRVGRFRSLGSTSQQSATIPVSPPPSTGTSVPAQGLATGVLPNGFGWALTTAGLEFTVDGGRSFSIVQSPIPESKIGDVAVDHTNVMVAGVSNAFPLIETSNDFGTTWKSVILPPGSGNAGSAKLVTQNGTIVGLMVTDMTSSSFSSGEWYDTSDRGATWTYQTAPSGGVVTALGEDLWLAGGPQSGSLYRSADRGVTWSKVSIPAAALTHGAALSVPGELSNGKVILVAATPNLGSASTFGVTVYVSSDRGAKWSALAHTSFVGRMSTGVTVAASIVGDAIWLGATTDGKFVKVSASGNLATTSRIGGVYPGGAISSISASGSASAWVMVLKGVCPSGKSSCIEDRALVRTVNGGQAWALVNVDPVTVPLASGRAFYAIGPCSTANLALGIGNRVSPMTGEHGVIYTLTNRGKTICQLYGYPVVSLYDYKGHLLPFKYTRSLSQYMGHAVPKPVNLRPGDRAYFLVAKYRCDIGVVAEATTIHVYPPNSRQQLIGHASPSPGVGSLTYCKGGSEDPGQIVDVSPVRGSPRFL